MSIFKLSLLFMLMCVVLLLFNMPASLFGTFLNKSCSNQCRLADAHGGFWSGNGILFVRERRGGKWLNLGKLDWRSGWSSGVTPRLRLDLNGGILITYVTLTGWRAEFNRFSIPAQALLGHVGHALPATGWGGMLEAAQGKLAKNWAGNTPEGHGRVYWRKASSVAFSSRTLGDYKLNWQSSSAGETHFSLDTLRGMLTLVGQGSVRRGVFSFNGSAEVENAQESILLSLLANFGRPDPSFPVNPPLRYLLKWPQ